jgi:mannose-1-phosphate guanylyltransferase
MHIKKAVILAGGMGERLRPLTDTTPKPLLPIQSKPILEHVIINLRKHKVCDIVISVGYKADMIEAYFRQGRKWGVNISYAIEKSPLGTGGALKEASKGITEAFIGLNGDNVADFNYEAMYNLHCQNKAQITIALTPVRDVSQFGVARVDNNRILAFVEKPKTSEAPSNLINAGAYILEPSVLQQLPPGKSSIERDCFEKLAPTGIIFAYKHIGQWYPTDDMTRYTTADQQFRPLC